MKEKLMTIVNRDWLLLNTKEPLLDCPFYVYTSDNAWYSAEDIKPLIKTYQLVGSKEFFEFMLPQTFFTGRACSPKVIDNQKHLQQAACNLIAKHGIDNVIVRCVGVSGWGGALAFAYGKPEKYKYTYKILPDNTEHRFTMDLLEN